MKRIPSIHIRKDDLEKVLRLHGPITLENIDDMLKICRRYSLETRSIFIDSKIEKQKIEKRVDTPTGDANLLSDIIYSVRVSLKHIGVTKIKQGDNQWSSLKGLVSVVNEYCNARDIPKKEGYTNFVRTGLELLNNGKKKPNYAFICNNLLQMADTIAWELEAKYLIANDQAPEATAALHNAYVRMVSDRTGIYQTYNKNPNDYINFIKARDVADSLNIDYEDYVFCHFKYLEFCGGIPKITDLHGENATKRVIPYLSEAPNVKRDTPKIDWSSFKGKRS